MEVVGIARCWIGCWGGMMEVVGIARCWIGCWGGMTEVVRIARCWIGCWEGTGRIGMEVAIVKGPTVQLQQIE